VKIIVRHQLFSYWDLVQDPNIRKSKKDNADQLIDDNDVHTTSSQLNKKQTNEEVVQIKA
jgi:hypothetical protein